MSAVEYVNDNGKARYQPAASDGARLWCDEHGYHSWDAGVEPVLYRSRRRAERRAAEYERSKRHNNWQVNA